MMVVAIAVGRNRRLGLSHRMHRIACILAPRSALTRQVQFLTKRPEFADVAKTACVPLVFTNQS